MSYKLDRKNVRQGAFKTNFIQIHTIIQFQVIKVLYVTIEFEDPVGSLSDRLSSFCLKTELMGRKMRRNRFLMAMESSYSQSLDLPGPTFYLRICK